MKLRFLHQKQTALSWGLAGLVVLILVGIIAAPLLAILKLAFFEPETNTWGLASFLVALNTPNFRLSFNNSLVLGISCTAIVIPLAYGYAAALTRTRLPAWLKNALRLWALIPLLAPSLLPAIALVYLFGNQGILKSWFPDGGIYGFWGVLIGEVFFTFPHALMILWTALRLADNSLYEAARGLGASKIRVWLSVTLSNVRYGLLSAAMVVFTLTVTDFGVAKVLGGQLSVLALEAYKQVIGQQNFSQGAVIGVFLLLPALLAFGLDAYAQRKQQTLSSHLILVVTPPINRWRDASALMFCLLVGGGLLVILGTALAAAFIEAWPYKLTFSLQHFQFEDSGFEGWLAFSNSLIVASFSAIFGTILVFVGALLTEKHAANLVWKKPLHSLAMLPMATPGLVLGLGYVLFFNHPQNPLNGLYGSLTLLVLCSIAHFYTTAHLTALTALKQLNLALEVAALTLKVPFWVTAWRVTLPICLPACVDIARYFFIASMTTVSAVAFLYTPDTLLASISVLSMDDMGDTAAAAAMSSLIFISCVLACGVFSLLNALLSKRHQAWQRQF